MKANPELRKRIAEIFLTYYQDTAIQKSILSYCEDREVALIAITNDKEFPCKKLRNLKLDTETSFKYNVLNKFAFFKEPYNLYYSCAKYQFGVPIFYFTGDDKDTVKKRVKEWGMNCKKDVIQYDLSIDIDSPSFKDTKIAKEDTLKIYKHLSKKQPVEIRFTGCGFHLVLNNEWHGTDFNTKDLDKMYKKAIKLKNKYSELIDTHVIEPRRVIKIPNTLVYREGYENIMICKTLTLEQLEKLKLEDVTYAKIPQE